MLEQWLRQEQYACWGLVTAWNPGSQLVSGERNQLEQEKLRKLLLCGNFSIFLAENYSDLGLWPMEPSFFVPELSCQETLSLAGKVGQNACLWGQVGELSKLLWV